MFPKEGCTIYFTSTMSQCITHIWLYKIMYNKKKERKKERKKRKKERKKEKRKKDNLKFFTCITTFNTYCIDHVSGYSRTYGSGTPS